MKVLVTGGAGYIGSTVCSALLDAGHEVVILDNLSRGRREFTQGRTFYEGDIADGAIIDKICSEHTIDAVIDCAAYIVVPESVEKPIEYYQNNVAKFVSLVESLVRNNVNRVVFSSSASIYAPNDEFQVDETSPLTAGSPYANSKLITEMMLEDIVPATKLSAISLRYFNPIGSDPKLRTGQQIEHPTHVLGKLMDAWMEESTFTVTGVEWPTRDGSGIRDYIHVWDLARAHVAAVEKFDEVTKDERFQAINLGTGNGVTVKELVKAFEGATGRALNVVFGPPRPGDVAGCYTISTKAKDLLGWEAELSEEDGIRDAINWIPKRKEILGY